MSFNKPYFFSNEYYVPAFEIKAAGTKLEPKVMRSVLSISVQERLNDPTVFDFEINDPDLTFIDQKIGVLTEGTEIEIKFGYVGNLMTMVIGEIATLEANFPESGAPSLNVRGYDFLHRLTRGKSNVSKIKTSLEVIVKEIAEKAKLESKVETDEKIDYYAQFNSDDLSFLKKIMKRLGLNIWVEREGKQDYLHVGDRMKKPKDTITQQPITLEWGRTLKTFNASLSTVGQVENVVVYGGNASTNEKFAGTAKGNGRALSASGRQQISQGSGGRSEEVIVDPTILSQQAAGKAAEIALDEITSNLFSVNGSCIGDPKLRIGVILDLKKVGRFSDKYKVISATHRIGGNGYDITFEARREK